MPQCEELYVNNKRRRENWEETRVTGESISSSAGDETQALKGSSGLESLWQCLG